MPEAPPLPCPPPKGTPKGDPRPAHGPQELGCYREGGALTTQMCVLRGALLKGEACSWSPCQCSSSASGTGQATCVCSVW